MVETKKSQLIKIAERLPYLPDLSFNILQYRKILERAKEFYKKEWRGSEKPSPAFAGRTVRATNYGWRHIVGKAFTTNRKNVIKRLNHLRNAKQILEKTDFLYETKKEIDRDKMINRYSILGKLENGQVLKVAVKEVNNELIFVSVYDTAKIKKDDKETHELQGSE